MTVDNGDGDRPPLTEFAEFALQVQHRKIDEYCPIWITTYHDAIT